MPQYISFSTSTVMPGLSPGMIRFSFKSYRYSIRFYCMGSVGMTQEWVLTDNITSAETVVQMMFNSMPEDLRKIFF